VDAGVGAPGGTLILEHLDVFAFTAMDAFFKPASARKLT